MPNSLYLQAMVPPAPNQRHRNTDLNEVPTKTMKTAQSQSIQDDVPSTQRTVTGRMKLLLVVTVQLLLVFASVPGVDAACAITPDDAGNVVIPALQTSIADNAFYGCTDLKTITFASDGMLDSIGNDAFTGSGLTSVTIPSNVTIGEFAFFRLISLKSVTFEGGVVGSIGYCAFNGCASLLSVTFPDDAISIDIDEGAFDRTAISQCAIAPDINGAVVIPNTMLHVSLAFYNCTGLTSVTFASGNQLEAIGNYAFYKSELTSISIPSNVRSILGEAFQDCDSLKTVTLASGSMLNSIANYGFYYCTSLNSFNFPDNDISIGTDAFSKTSIKRCAIDPDPNGAVLIPADLHSLPILAFYNCSGLTSVEFAYGNDQFESINNYAFYGTGMTSILIPSNIRSIGANAFEECTSLKSVSYTSDSVLSSIGDGAFLGSGLTSNIVPSSVLSIGAYAFLFCGSLKRVVFLDDSLLGSIGFATFAHSGLTSISIPFGITTLGTYDFWRCYSLRNVVFASGSMLGSIGIAAFGHSGLTSISIPSNVAIIDDRAFYGCNSLKSVIFSENVGMLSSIGFYAFYGATNLTLISVPSGVTTIGDNAFDECTSLKTVNFLAGCKNTVSIGENAFNNTQVSSIALPSNASCNSCAATVKPICLPTAPSSSGDAGAAGAVIGGCLGGLALVVAVYFYFDYKRKAALAAAADTTPETKQVGSTPNPLQV